MPENLFASLRYTLLILSIVFTAENSRAQSIEPAITNTAGNTYAQGDIIYEWSIGELALVETMMNHEGSITNGLLQPVVPTQIITKGFIVYPTNVLTPNGDGSNDTWIIKDLDRYPDNEITVFDRAGRQVYHVNGYQNDWKGTLSGAPLAEDTYYYIIKLTKAGQYSAPIKGFITIVH